MRKQPATQGLPKFLTAAEAAARLGVVPEQVRRLVRGGELAAHRTGSGPNSHYRISEQAIADYIKRHSAPAKAAS